MCIRDRKKAAQDAQAALEAQALAREQTLKEEVKAAQDDAFQARYKLSLIHI